MKNNNIIIKRAKNEGINQYVGKKIREIRKANNISQERLAEKFGYEKSLISHWESGRKAPSLEIIDRFCVLCQVTPNELLGIEESRGEENDAIDISDLSEADKNLIRTMVDRLRKG